ncbi:MAG: hypothetical protein J6V54_01315 [Bacteroidales bacterium]|nr:hypothetical protein [Bacteroidales bacterium]
MKRTLTRLSLVMIATALVFTGCKKDQEDENNGGGGVTVSGTIAGHDYVDLGLPSGTKWATCNVGASTPEEYGNYYAWGETSTKTEYTEENSVTYGQQMSDISGNAQYDAATANWGSTWRIPNRAEVEELIDNCTWTWTTQNGVNGIKVTGTNGNSIFLPAAGVSNESIGLACCYYSSFPGGEENCCVYGIYSDLEDSDRFELGWLYRYAGFTVRPVSN